MDKFKKFFDDGDSGAPAPSGAKAGDSEGLMDELNQLCKLSYKTRLIGFASCCAIGIVISFLSFITIANPVRFAVLYSFGNLVSLAATMFLMGPVKQFKNMFDEKRRVATIVYLSALVATLVIALWQGKKLVILVLLLVVVQFLALIWYTLSYIPYGRTVAASAVTGCFKK